MEAFLADFLENLNEVVRNNEIRKNVRQTEVEKQCLLENKETIIKYILQNDHFGALAKLNENISTSVTTGSNVPNTICTWLPNSGKLTDARLEEMVAEFGKILKVDREWHESILQQPGQTEVKDFKELIVDYSELEREYVTKSTTFLSNQSFSNATGDCIYPKEEIDFADRKAIPNQSKYCPTCCSNELQQKTNEWSLMTNDTVIFDRNLTKLLKILTGTLRDYEHLKTSHENVCNKCKIKMMKYHQVEYEAGSIATTEMQRYSEAIATLTSQKEKETELSEKCKKLTEKTVKLEVINSGLEVHHQKYAEERDNIYKEVQELLRIDTKYLELEEVTKLMDAKYKEMEKLLVDTLNENPPLEQQSQLEELHVE